MSEADMLEEMRKLGLSWSDAASERIARLSAADAGFVPAMRRTAVEAGRANVPGVVFLPMRCASCRKETSAEAWNAERWQPNLAMWERGWAVFFLLCESCSVEPSEAGKKEGVVDCVDAYIVEASQKELDGVEAKRVPIELLRRSIRDMGHRRRGVAK